MPKWNVIFDFNIERTYEVEAPDEATAIKTARDKGLLLNESEDSSALQHVERKGE